MRYLVILLGCTGLLAGTLEGKIVVIGQERVPSGAVVFAELLDGEPQAYVIDVRDQLFVPKVAMVPRDVPVVFRNTGTLAHNLFARSGPNTFNGGRLDPGEQETFRFRETGLVEIHCKVYGDMRGFVLVRDQVSWSEVAADGSFRLSQLPPGAYRLGTWVPGYPYQERKVTLTEGGRQWLDLTFAEKETAPAQPVAVLLEPVAQKQTLEVDASEVPVQAAEEETGETVAAVPVEPAAQVPAEVEIEEPAAALGGVMGRVRASGEVGSDPIVVTLVGAGIQAPRSDARYEVVTKQKQFIPHVLAVPKGAEVHFPNSDPIIHNVFSVSGSNSFDAGRYARDQGVSQRFDHEGLVKVFCNVHHEMNAYIVVADTPHIAYVGPNGSFNFNDIPAGTYSLQAWHPHGEWTRQEVTIEPGQSVSAELAIKLKERRIAHLNKLGKRYRKPGSEAY